jgi:hypothetical protein
VSAYALEKITLSNNKGSGTPKIGLIKAKHNKYRNSQVTSQKCPVHVIHHDYLHENPTMNQWDVYNAALTMSMLSQYRWVFPLILVSTSFMLQATCVFAHWLLYMHSFSMLCDYFLQFSPLVKAGEYCVYI